MLWKLRLRTPRRVEDVILKAPGYIEATQLAQQYAGRRQGQKVISIEPLVVAEWTPPTPTPDPPLTTPSTAQDTGISALKDLPAAGGIKPIKGT